MKNLIAYRTQNPLFNGLLFFSGITFMLTWLPLLRCLFDGKSYRWGQGYFGLSLSSAGLSADYLALILFFLLFLGFFASFYWIKNRKVFYLFLVLWWLHSFGNLLYELIRNGDTQFHGDTLDVHISLSAIVIPLAIIAALLILLVIRKDMRMPEVAIPWQKRNRNWALIILGPLLVQAPFFAFGEPHDITDQIGVLIAIVQSFLFPIMFFPEKQRSKE